MSQHQVEKENVICLLKYHGISHLSNLRVGTLVGLSVLFVAILEAEEAGKSLGKPTGEILAPGRRLRFHPISVRIITRQFSRFLGFSTRLGNEKRFTLLDAQCSQAGC